MSLFIIALKGVKKKKTKQNTNPALEINIRNAKGKKNSLILTKDHISITKEGLLLMQNDICFPLYYHYFTNRQEQNTNGTRTEHKRNKSKKKILGP